MILEAELVLSYYKEVAEVNREHEVKLVQHVETGYFYVKKILSADNFQIQSYVKNHPHRGLPHIFEIIKDEDNLIVIEEYINGKSLRDLLDVNNSFGEAMTVDIIEQLCDILKTLHIANPPVIHRDIKPSNLIISNDGVLKLIDFNAAKTMKTQGTKDTVLMGTAGYAAPEQYGFAPSGISTDIYAVGILMNELLTGKLPTQQTYKGRLSPIIDKCLQLDSKKRYLNVTQLKRALVNRGAGKLGNDKREIGQHQSWFPPGFRSKDPGSILAAVILYSLIFVLSAILEVVDVPMSQVWPYRIICLITMLATILLVGNYKNIQKHLWLTKSKNLLVRILGLVFWLVVIIIANATTLKLIIDVFFN